MMVQWFFDYLCFLYYISDKGSGKYKLFDKFSLTLTMGVFKVSFNTFQPRLDP